MNPRLKPRHLAILVVLAGCAGSPPPPDWQLHASQATERAVAAVLTGDSRVEGREMMLAREALARTGRPDLLARAELMRCAAHVASLDFAPCDGFEALRADAQPAEIAYAKHLAAQADRADAERLPPAQRGAVLSFDAGDAAAAKAVQGIDDPLARLIAAGVAFRAGRGSPALVATASATASAQGWRRPLLAWLGVEARLADEAGQRDAAERIRRRIALVQGAR